MIKIKISDNLERFDPILMPLTTTVREALEQVEVNYQNTMVELNHEPLSRGELDSTFADLFCEEGSVVFLTCIAKLNNAVRIVNFNTQYIVQTEFGFDDIDMCREHKPEALCVYPPMEFDPSYRVDYGEEFGMSRFGICFADQKDGKCSFTVACDSDEEFAAVYGSHIEKLKKIEESIEHAEAELIDTGLNITEMIEHM